MCIPYRKIAFAQRVNQNTRHDPGIIWRSIFFYDTAHGRIYRLRVPFIISQSIWAYLDFENKIHSDRTLSCRFRKLKRRAYNVTRSLFWDIEIYRLEINVVLELTPEERNTLAILFSYRVTNPSVNARRHDLLDPGNPEPATLINSCFRPRKFGIKHKVPAWSVTAAYDGR